MSEQLPYWATVLIWVVPYVVMLLVGIAIALVTIPRHPWTSGLVIVGCSLMILTSVSWQVLSFAMITWERWAWLDSWAWWGFGLGSSLLQTAGYALVLLAAFVGRLGRRA